MAQRPVFGAHNGLFTEVLPGYWSLDGQTSANDEKGFRVQWTSESWLSSIHLSAAEISILHTSA